MCVLTRQEMQKAPRSSDETLELAYKSDEVLGS